MLETLSRIQVLFFKLPEPVAEALQESLQGCNGCFHTVHELNELKQLLETTEYSLVLLGAESAASCDNDLRDLQAIINPEKCVLLVCPNGDAAVTVAEAAKFDVVQDVINLHDHQLLLERKCGLYLELLQRRLQAQEIQPQQLTRHDPVTGLVNVSLMRHFLLKAMARALRNDRRLAVLYIDLDDFHCINESFGLNGGNSLLKSVGQRIKNCIRIGDLVSRYQNDAFMVVLDEIRHDKDVEKVAQQIMGQLNTPHDLSGVPIISHASIGISFYPQGSIGIEGLIDQAIQAMRWVKLHGKNNLHVAGSEEQAGKGLKNKSFIH